MTSRRAARQGLGGARLDALGLILVGLVVAVWMDELLRRSGRPDLVSIGGDAVPYLLAMVSAGTGRGAGQSPALPPGRLAAAGAAMSVIVLGICDAYAAYGLLARPGRCPAPPGRPCT